MKINLLTKTGLVTALSFCIYFNVLAAEPTSPGADEYMPPVAGTQPSERPAGAPIVTEVVKDDSWYKAAETGLQAPFPNSFSFLVYQENWYNPFIHPGMIGPYDIRGWHDGESESAWKMPGW